MTAKFVTVPELALIAGTRAALGAGVGLLLADRLSREQRRAVGWTLVAVGALSTIPLAAEVIFSTRQPWAAIDEDAGRSTRRREPAAP